MSRQFIYFAGILLMMMAAVLAVSAQDIPVLNATMNNTSLNNTSLNNTTLNNTTLNLSANQTINVTTVNATTNETISAAENVTENLTTNVTINETLPAENMTAAIPVEAAPAAVEEPVDLAATTIEPVTVQPEAVAPDAAIVGQQQAAIPQAMRLGMTAKPMYVIGSGLSTSPATQVGRSIARTAYSLGSPAKSTVSL